MSQKEWVIINTNTGGLKSRLMVIAPVHKYLSVESLKIMNGSKGKTLDSSR